MAEGGGENGSCMCGINIVWDLSGLELEDISIVNFSSFLPSFWMSIKWDIGRTKGEGNLWMNWRG